MALKKCPMCLGHEPNNVHARVSNPPCSYCGGRGVLNTEVMCRCGRPGIRKLNDVSICGSYECGKRVLEATK
jgi:hypothetical protein